MNRPAPLRSFVLLAFLFFALTPLFSHAQEDTPGLVRLVGTDSASVENAYYLWVDLDNDTTAYHGIYAYGEGVFTLAKDLGLVTGFPDLFTRYPLGQVPLVLGPLGLSARFEPFHFGGWDSGTAGALSFQAGGDYVVSNDTFRYLGSSWNAKVLAGFRAGPWTFQGDYGFQGGLEKKALTQWTFNTGCGYRFAPDWYLQTEVDVYAVTSPFSETATSIVPQVAFQRDEWLLELGYAFNDSPSGQTQLLVARAF